MQYTSKLLTIIAFDFAIVYNQVSALYRGGVKSGNENADVFKEAYFLYVISLKV